MSDLKYWIWLSSISGVGPVTALKLLKRFVTPEAVFLAGASEYKGAEGLKPADILRLQKKNIAEAESIQESCDKAGYRIITLSDGQYPDRLRNIFDPPVILYIRGNLPDIDDKPVVAVVGTRNCTPYGLTAAGNTGFTLSRSGIVVVSGFARGIDTAAMRGALQGGGQVIGVVGAGLDVVYPRENKTLFEEVARSGAIVSEYPPGTPALAVHFPARNRIISGLSLGVAVIEAPKRSGALITAARALEQGRDVFSLPGSVYAGSSEGSNTLLREGAIPILSGEDIVTEYAELFPDTIVMNNDGAPYIAGSEQQSESRPAAGGKAKHNEKGIDNAHGVDYIDLEKIFGELDGDESIVARSLGRSALHTDEVITGSGLPASQVLPALTMLEIKGYAVREGSGIWRLVRSIPAPRRI